MLKSTILILTLLPTVVAQSKNANAKVTTPQNHSEYSQVPFDLSLEHLPAHFRGHDIELLWSAFHKAHAATTTPIIGSITARNTLAFVPSHLEFATDIAGVLEIRL